MPASSPFLGRCLPVTEPMAAVIKPLERLVVIGLGLIGGSFAKGMREAGLFREVVGVDLDAESCRLAVELGVVDRCESDLAAGLCRCQCHSAGRADSRHGEAAGQSGPLTAGRSGTDGCGQRQGQYPACRPS